MQQYLIVKYRGVIVSIIDIRDTFTPAHKILDWYSEVYEFERCHLTGVFSGMIQFKDSMLNETVSTS